METEEITSVNSNGSAPGVDQLLVLETSQQQVSY